MLKRILINREDREIRVGFLEDEELVELHVEQADQKSIVGNIYKGIVQDVKPGLQAAFIDCGLERNVFLHFMDIRAESLVLGEENWREAMHEAAKAGIPGFIHRPGRRPKPDPRNPGAAPPPIEKGDELIVQIVKDEIGTKAPRASTNLSIPGRYLVLLPFPSQQGGVSRKIAMGEDRYRLKKLLSRLRDDETSFIIRTAGTEQSEEVIKADVESLRQLWQRIIERYRSLKGPGLVFSEHEILGRLVRDAFSEDTDEIWCDDDADAAEVKARLSESIPELAERVYHYDEPEPIFERFGAEKQIQRAMGRKVWLKSGGAIVIDENEALTAIDVNSGRFTGGKDQERTSLKINLEACKTIAQQIRLRDIGGIIVIDFIDMLSHSNQAAVEEALRTALRKDRTKITIGRIGDFGLMQLTRKRRKESLKNHVFDDCPYCQGSGKVLSKTELLRRLRHAIRSVFSDGRICKGVVITANPTFAHHLKHEFNDVIQTWQELWDIGIEIRSDLDCHFEDFIVTPTLKPITRLHRIESPRREEVVMEMVDSAEDVPGPVAPYELDDEWAEDEAPELAAPVARAGEGSAWTPSHIGAPPAPRSGSPAGRGRSLPPRPPRATPVDSGALTPDSVPLRFGNAPSETPVPGSGQEAGGEGGRRRKRRRRGRGGRRFDDQLAPSTVQDPAQPGAPAAAESEDGSHEVGDDFGPEGDEPERAEPERTDSAAGEPDAYGRRRTRRGSRGGRRRRRRGNDFPEGIAPIELAGAPAAGQPVASPDAVPADLMAPVKDGPVRIPRPPRPPRVGAPAAAVVVAEPTMPLAPVVQAPVVAVAPAPPAAHPAVVPPTAPAAPAQSAWPRTSLSVIDLTGKKSAAPAPPRQSPMAVFAANVKPPAVPSGEGTGPVTRLVLGNASAEPKPKASAQIAKDPPPPSGLVMTGGVPILDLTVKGPRPPRPAHEETASTILAPPAAPETATAPSEVAKVAAYPVVEPPALEVATLPVEQADLFVTEATLEKPKARRSRKAAEPAPAPVAAAEPPKRKPRRPKAAEVAVEEPKPAEAAPKATEVAVEEPKPTKAAPKAKKAAEPEAKPAKAPRAPKGPKAAAKPEDAPAKPAKAVKPAAAKAAPATPKAAAAKAKPKKAEPAPKAEKPAKAAAKPKAPAKARTAKK